MCRNGLNVNVYPLLSKDRYFQSYLLPQPHCKLAIDMLSNGGLGLSCGYKHEPNYLDLTCVSNL